MMCSSLGFHTLTLSTLLFFGEFSQLNTDFKNYSNKTASIQIYINKYGNYKVKFFQEDKGIKWLIRRNVWLEDMRVHVDIVDVTINPKILGGVKDYITAATYKDMDAAIRNFNRISREISPILNVFENYSLKRIDYCINFSLHELAPKCTVENVMKLIKRSAIPPHYKEWTRYDEVSHRCKSSPASFYLISSSVNINCYSKYMKFQEQNGEKGCSPIAQKTLDAARDIIRFEVQCKYHKTYTLNRKARKAGNEETNKYKELLSDDYCRSIINEYYNRTIGRGHWYSLEEAITMVLRQKFNKQKENRLINALQEVSLYRSLERAKSLHQGSDLAAFKRTLNDLSRISINPVTIPQEWGVDRIWNLLDNYYAEESLEYFQKEIERDIFFDYRQKKK